MAVEWLPGDLAEDLAEDCMPWWCMSAGTALNPLSHNSEEQDIHHAVKVLFTSVSPRCRRN